MKKMTAVLVTTLIGTNVYAATLQCWDTYFMKPRTPYMSATIENDNTLSNMRYHYRNSITGKVPVAPVGELVGELITTNRSPYKGMNDFAVGVKDPENGLYRLILPADLSAANLAKLAGAKGNKENGVLIGDTLVPDGAGSHLSVRLTCKSDK